MEDERYAGRVYPSRDRDIEVVSLHFPRRTPWFPWVRRCRYCSETWGRDGCFAYRRADTRLRSDSHFAWWSV